MADDKFRAGLNDDDILSQYPSAASPLTALGLDPAMVRANPSLLDAFKSGSPAPPSVDKTPVAGAMAMPTEPQPVAATAPVPTAAPRTPSMADYEQSGLSGLSRNAQAAERAANEIPTSNPEYAALSARRGALAMPPSRFDPQTGKSLSQVTEQVYNPQTDKMEAVTVNPKASVGSKIWRGVRGGLVGLATGGIPGALVGALEPEATVGGTAYGAPSSAYQHAEERRADQLNATDASLKTSFENLKAAADSAGKKSSEHRAIATTNKDLVAGADSVTKTGVEQQKADDLARKDAAEAAAGTPEAKSQAAVMMEQAKVNARATDPIGKQLPKGYIRNRYIATGEVQSAHEATGGEQQVAALTAAWKREHPDQKYLPSADLAKIYSQVGGRSELEDNKPNNAGDSNLRASLRSATAHLKDLQDIQKGTGYLVMSPTEKEEFKAKIESAQKDYDDLQEQMHPTPNSEVVTVRDGNGNVGTLPKSNLAEAQKRDAKLVVVTQ